MLFAIFFPLSFCYCHKLICKLKWNVWKFPFTSWLFMHSLGIISSEAKCFILNNLFFSLLKEKSLVVLFLWEKSTNLATEAISTISLDSQIRNKSLSLFFCIIYLFITTTPMLNPFICFLSKNDIKRTLKRFNGMAVTKQSIALGVMNCPWFHRK